MLYFIMFFIICAIALNMWIFPDIITSPISGDGFGYYGYLPATFIHHDWNMTFVSAHWGYGISEINQIVLRNPIGVSVLMFPFFILAHGLTLLMETYEADGYSMFYQVFMLCSTLTYAVLGIFLTYKILIKKFEKNIAILSLIAITFGCGILFYTTAEATYSHVYSFFAIALFIYLVINEKKLKKRMPYYFILGLNLSLIFLCRNVNILIIIFYLLYNFKNIKTKIHYKKILPMLLGFILLMIPQMIYWKIQGGHLLLNTYKFQNNICTYNSYFCFREHFEFLHRHLINNWFSVKKGLFYYYPVMVYALCGFFWLKKYYKKAFLSIICFLIPMVYVIVSWSQWWYGFSFGQRAYIDYMAIFAILIATTLSAIKDNLNKKIYYASVIYMLVLTLASVVIMFLILTLHCTDIGTLLLK